MASQCLLSPASRSAAPAAHTLWFYLCSYTVKWHQMPMPSPGSDLPPRLDPFCPSTSSPEAPPVRGSLSVVGQDCSSHGDVGKRGQSGSSCTGHHGGTEPLPQTLAQLPSRQAPTPGWAPASSSAEDPLSSSIPPSFIAPRPQQPPSLRRSLILPVSLATPISRWRSVPSLPLIFLLSLSSISSSVSPFPTSVLCFLPFSHPFHLLQCLLHLG